MKKMRLVFFVFFISILTGSSCEERDLSTSDFSKESEDSPLPRHLLHNTAPQESIPPADALQGDSAPQPIHLEQTRQSTSHQAPDEEVATSLVRAAKNNDIALVRKRMQGLQQNKQEEMNETDSEGFTALMYAVIHHNAQMVDLFISHGADMNRQGLRGFTALMWAIYNVEIMEKLLDAGALIEIKNEWGQTVFLLAAAMGQTPAMRLLLEADLDVEAQDQDGTNALIAACYHAREDAVDLLIETGVLLNAANQGGQTPLMVASMKNHKGVMKKLLEAGAQIDRLDQGHCTALSWAVKYNQVEAVDLLLSYNASMDNRNSNNESVFNYAGKTEVLIKLYMKYACSKIQICGWFERAGQWIQSLNHGGAFPYIAS